MAGSESISDSKFKSFSLSGESVLVIGHSHPESGATAAGIRMMQLLRAFKKEGAEIHFAVSSKPGRYCDSLATYVSDIHEIRLNDSSFDTLVKKLDCSVALFDRFMTEEQYGWRVRTQLPQCRLLLDTEDLHSLRLSRQEAVQKGVCWTEDLWTKHPVFYREMASILRCDLSLMISRAEIQLLTGVFPWISSRLVYAPFQMEAPGDSKNTPFEQRKNFVFSGNGKHAPNLDAIQTLRNSVWPELSQLCPQTELHIYGAYLEDVRFETANFPGADRFVIKGHAPNIGEVFQKARLQLAPLRFGAGVKGKIISAIQNGLPTLSTPIGWEGIGETHNNPLAVNEISQMAQRAAKFYQQQALWQDALQAGQHLARDHFEYSDKTSWLPSVTYDDRAIPQEARLISEILRSRAFDASRFMSKWIEAKNAKRE